MPLHMIDYGRPIEHNIIPIAIVTGLAMLLAIISVPQALLSSNFYLSALTYLSELTGISTGSLRFGLPVISGITAWAGYRYVNIKATQAADLAYLMTHKANALNYNLKKIDSRELDFALESFGDLMRGSHSRVIRDAYRGTHAGNGQKYAYRAFQLHYVEAIQRTNPGDDDHGFSHTEFDYFDLYRAGIILDFPEARSLYITTNFETNRYPARYTSGLPEFDKDFSCWAADEPAMARLLHPAVVETLMNAAKSLPGLAVEVNEDGVMCITAQIDHVVTAADGFTEHADRSMQIANPEAFKDRLDQQRQMEHLDRMLALADRLKGQAQSNFSS